ncbi:MAG: LD-carboxypeptidase [Calditrichaeota bacterium]|nr:LD-carboxypeptidase [Calditrichota bacterium]MCB9391630.1 LD-carboxypeptidase [Calditrichota bacterium]
MLKRPLLPGGTIGICAPAGPVKREKLEAAILRIEQRGYRVVLSPSVFSRLEFLSANDVTRLRELEEMFQHDKCDAVFAARGGVGTSRLLARSDFSAIATSATPFLGFSDTTALQFALWKQHKCVTFSGPLAVEFDGTLTEATESFCFECLAGKLPENWLLDFSSANWEVIRSGAREIVAPLLPGNLTMITTLLGTPFLPDLRGCILAIEDIAEPPYRVDRLLFHLKNAGAFEHLAALLIGDFGWPPEDIESRELLLESVRAVTENTTYPVLAGLPYGHGPERLTLPVGAPVRLSILESSVRLGSALSPFESAV